MPHDVKLQYMIGGRFLALCFTYTTIFFRSSLSLTLLLKFMLKEVWVILSMVWAQRYFIGFCNLIQLSVSHSWYWSFSWCSLSFMIFCEKLAHLWSTTSLRSLQVAFLCIRMVCTGQCHGMEREYQIFWLNTLLWRFLMQTAVSLLGYGASSILEWVIQLMFQTNQFGLTWLPGNAKGISLLACKFCSFLERKCDYVINYETMNLFFFFIFQPWYVVQDWHFESCIILGGSNEKYPSITLSTSGICT